MIKELIFIRKNSEIHGIMKLVRYLHDNGTNLETLNKFIDEVLTPMVDNLEQEENNKINII